MQTTGKTKIELAQDSEIWTASVDHYGTYSTRTFDRYLNINKFGNMENFSSETTNSVTPLLFTKLSADEVRFIPLSLRASSDVGRSVRI